MWGEGGGHNFNNNKEHCDPDILTVECVNLHFTSMFSEFLIRRFSILDLIHFWVMITCLAASSGSAPYFIWGGAPDLLLGCLPTCFFSESQWQLE